MGEPLTSVLLDFERALSWSSRSGELGGGRAHARMKIRGVPRGDGGSLHSGGAPRYGERGARGHGGQRWRVLHGRLMVLLLSSRSMRKYAHESFQSDYPLRSGGAGPPEPGYYGVEQLLPDAHASAVLHVLHPDE